MRASRCVVSAAKGTSTRASIDLRLICMPSLCPRADGARAGVNSTLRAGTGVSRSQWAAASSQGTRKPQTATAPHQPSPIPDVGPRKHSVRLTGSEPHPGLLGSAQSSTVMHACQELPCSRRGLAFW